MKPPRARINDGQPRTPRILKFKVQPSLTRAMQRIGSADTSAATDPQTRRQPRCQLRQSLILVRYAFPRDLVIESKSKVSPTYDHFRIILTDYPIP